MLSLEIPRDILDAMVAQARAELPNEACGLLAGRSPRVEKRYQMTNTNQSGEHFMMAPDEQFAAVKAIRAAGLEMLAIYHSHPETPARPSNEDIRLALTPGVAHVIISLQNHDRPGVKGFDIGADCVTEVCIQVTEPAAAPR